MTRQTPDAPRAHSGVRVLVANTLDEIRVEIARIGVCDEDVCSLAAKGMARVVRLEHVPVAAAQIIKREMRAQGGDTALHCGANTNGGECSAMLLLGSETVFRQVCANLHGHLGGLATTAMAILDALRAYDDLGGTLRCGPYSLPLGRKTYIMGILNVTPDSFSGDGLRSLDAVRRRAEAMLAAGADLLDIGGESTRPGATEVPLAEELLRVVPAVRALATLRVPLSVDTYKSVVAYEALDAGATLINDISGLRFDPAMAVTVAAARVPVVVMHIQGTPRDMQRQPHYHDLMSEVCAYLQASSALAIAAGMSREQVILDPGFGFGKTPSQNLELIRRLRELTSYGQPILLGTSRKSTIGVLLGGLPPEERLEGTAATVALGIANGADIVRVHDVQAMARVARVADAIVRQATTS